MLAFFSRYSKTIAWFFISLFYIDVLFFPIFTYGSPIEKAAWSHGSGNYGQKDYSKKTTRDLQGIENGYFPGNGTGSIKNVFSSYQKNKTINAGPGPTQPEMQSFNSVNVNNMVDLFSGDFSYNIPLLDVGGYPINIAYRSGVNMDQEASWVGLGWNINPGTITRNLRGLPDDFDGVDSIKKIAGIKTNKTIGVTGGVDLEITGFPISVGASLGIFNNNYKGWGLENSVNASINAGTGAGGVLSGGLSITNNSQEGLTLAPSLSLSLSQNESDQRAGIAGSFSVSAPYNSRTGLKGLQLSAGLRQFKTDKDNQNRTYTDNASGYVSSQISFAYPSYTPSITLPFTSRQYSFTAKVGTLATVVHPSFFISGYVSKQQIDPVDTLLALPAYGYLHYQDGAVNKNSLLDFNREKELAYREKPPVPHIAVPIYTYDAFSITGEGTGGMFRAYRGDIGFVFDHAMRTKDGSARASVDVGLGELVHAGVDLNVTRAFTQNGAWLDQNSMSSIINFKKDSASFEASYFRNPGEKSINSKIFYNAIGGDDVVTVALAQAGASSSVIQATNYLNRYRNKQFVGQSLLTKQNTIRPERDKRSQVISYLTAREADVAGLSKYIENYAPNQFTLDCSINGNSNPEGSGTGIPGQYFPQRNFKGFPNSRTDDSIAFNWATGSPFTSGFPSDNFSTRWVGRLLAPATGTYTFTTQSDDGVRLWLNDSILINHWNDHAAFKDSVKVNLVGGQTYTLRMEYYENKGKAVARLYWSYPGQSSTLFVPEQYLYPPAIDTFKVSNLLVKEKRYNDFRKPNHISEIDVLNTDGRRYVYGIPVYNFKQKEVSFAVNGSLNGNVKTGLTAYSDADNSVANNNNGKDHYFGSEEIPAYAHSFLLTGILSNDYVDITGNGITDDDLGDAIRFNYSKICGVKNPYRWRAPYIKDSATYNDGLKTDSRDDKASYTYGEKELWYLHSIQSKTMIATFVLENRFDLLGIDEKGRKYNDSTAKRLKEIDLYSKADLIKNGANARPIKTIHFEYSYELCKGVNKPIIDSGKLTLKKIWFTYNGNEKGKQNPYIFNYNPQNPDYNIKSYDRWGNYKDPLQNPGSSVGNTITNAEYPYALQDSTQAAQNAAAWNLDSIYLPSGGSIKVKYESDDYAYVQNKRAMQLFKLAGLGSAPGLTNPSNKLYTSTGDNLYVYVTLTQAITSTSDFYQKYLSGIKKFYLKLFVRMPSDQWGSGSEYVPCYADLDPVNGYGMVNANLAWIKLSGISLPGDGSGNYSPLVKAAVQFLRLNLPSKAYPGSEIGDNIDLADAVKLIFSLADNIKSAFSSFDATARQNSWVTDIDTSRTFIRLCSPLYKKYGGGHRVKRITLYDNWNQMTGGRTATYGQDYTYTTQQQINGVTTTISSGVASYEPGIGGEENPFHEPIEYIEKISALGPVTLGYSEEPLGESFFPGAGVGYSKVRVRTINFKNIKSANGYDETNFYTALDFPVYTDRTVLDNDTKKRYKPALANFLRINARNFIALSQGFKIELNDMHGKLRSQASYAETDPNNPVTYTENIYRIDSSQVSNGKRLSNTVMTIKPDGTIDSAALVGKDAELMVDMREQVSVTNGNNVSLNTDLFALPFIPPFFVIPSFISLAQREQNQFRSVATTKIIQRYGILDSVVHIDKGSKTSTRDLLYDAETGDVVLTRTQNEFNDPVYSFNYPSHWAYDGMGPAYKNIDLVLQHISISSGRVVSGLAVPDSTIFCSGDEILVAGKQQTGNPVGCVIPFATFPTYTTIYALDSSVLRPGPKAIYFIDRDGNPYGGSDISLKIIRSGRRNMFMNIGAVSSLRNPVVYNGVAHTYNLQVNDSAKVVTASAGEFSNFWYRSSSCKSCAVGKQNGTGNSCFLDTVPVITDTFTVCFTSATNDSYSSCGSYIYTGYGVGYTPFIRHRIPITNSFWIDSATRLLQCNYTPVDTLDPGGNFQSFSLRGIGLNPIIPAGDTSSTSKFKALAQPALDTNHVGPLNRCGIWLCPHTIDTPYNKWIGLTTSITCPQSKIYSIGMAGDNRVRLTIDGQLFKEDDSTLNGSGFLNAENFRIWHIYPVFLSQGKHTLLIQGFNAQNVGSFGCEIYGNPADSLQYAHSYSDLELIFSTKNIIGQTFPANYSCPINYQLDTSGGKFICRSTITASRYANPYASGILGNWKSQRNYVYYNSRNQSDPTTATNIRTDGTIKAFNPFWVFQSNTLKPQYDTTRWVWNSEAMQFNRKGFEAENRDPLGRYNAGLYGYNLTLPTAAIQNSRERESAFEGFEDYNFIKPCDTACIDKRHWDFSAYAANITTTQKHSGKNSLQVNASQQAAVNVDFSDSLQDRAHPSVRFNTSLHSCVSAFKLLDSLTYTSDTLFALFSPSKGRRMLLSAWVKESQDCNTTTYQNNQIVITYKGGSFPTTTLKPAGPIIEGWERYEGIFDIPLTATGMTVSLQATGGVAVYFDDLRVHPFNANMKSFVYNPFNLRLMAELDENNYTTFYEYDDDGTLIRVKKETERGIQTIKESRSALIK